MAALPVKKKSVFFKGQATGSLTKPQWVHRQHSWACAFFLFFKVGRVHKGWGGPGMIRRWVWLGYMMWNYQIFNKHSILTKRLVNFRIGYFTITMTKNIFFKYIDRIKYIIFHYSTRLTITVDLDFTESLSPGSGWQY